MKFSLLKFVKEQDELGHPIGLTYKGEETHQSLFGGVLSVILSIFAISFLVVKAEKVITMSDPTITTFPRPMNQEMRDGLGNINIKDQGANFAFKLKVSGEGMA